MTKSPSLSATIGQHSTTEQTDDQTTIHQLVLSCLPAISAIARRYGKSLRHSDIDDLISAAMLSIMERASEALDKTSPTAWLICIARHRIQSYIMCEDDLIQHQAYTPRICMQSLDAPVSQESDAILGDQITETSYLDHTDRDYSTLYQALHKLSPKRRDAIARHFGLLGHPATPLRDMAPSRREQQAMAKTITMAKKTLASLLMRSTAVA